jgi:hypothetical protein
MRPLNLRARRGLDFIHAVVQATEPRFQLLGALAGKTGLLPRKFSVGLGSLRVGDGLVRVPPLLRQLAPEFPLLGLRSGQPLRQPAAFVFRGRLLPTCIRMLRPETLDFGSKLQSQGARHNMVGEGGRLSQKPMRFATT